MPTAHNPCDSAAMINRIKSAIKRPETLFYAVAAFLLLSLGLMIVIDVFDAFGWRTRWLASGEERFYFWMHWYSSPVENPMQWFLLGSGVGIFALGAGAAYQRQKPEEFEFALLMSLALGVMFLEDVADPRHSIRTEMENIFGASSYGVLGSVVELTYFAMVGALLLYVFFRFRKTFWPHKKVRKFLVAGYGFYALAVGSSWLGSAFQSLTAEGRVLYTVLGNAAMGLLFRGNEEMEQLFLTLDMQAQTLRGHPIGFYFMDRVWEESIELLGAAALVVAGLAFFQATAGASRHESTEDSAPENNPE